MDLVVVDVGVVVEVDVVVDEVLIKNLLENMRTIRLRL